MLLVIPSMIPEEGESNPDKQLGKVVLPDSDSPTIETKPIFSNESETSFNQMYYIQNNIGQHILDI